MSLASDHLHTREHRGFTLVFTRGTDHGRYLYHSVQILTGALFISRITLARPDAATDDVVQLLDQRAGEWIDDYLQRQPVKSR